MQLLKDRILKDGYVRAGNILKVDSFLNHQIDIPLYEAIGNEFKKRFSDVEVTKILTIESSGIGIACITAQSFGVNVIFAKKAKSKNLDSDVYTCKIDSFTHDKTYDVMVSTKFINADDKVLIIDDFLAKGKAALGLIDIVNQAGAKVAGVGIVIEKGFQEGGVALTNQGIRLESLVVVDSLENSTIKFR
jgi:xanthine phosphoribosyltransferase